MKKRMLFTCVLLSSVGISIAAPAKKPGAKTTELTTGVKSEQQSVQVAQNARSQAKDTHLDPSEVLYVDMQQAMLHSKQGADAQKMVEKEEKKYGELAQKEQQRMMQLKTNIETKSSMLSADARRKQEKELADMQRDFQNKMQDWKYELQYTMQRETDAMVKDIEQAAITLAKDTGKAAVIDVQTGRALYLRNDKNSTNMLVAELDKQYTIKLAQKEKEKRAVTV